MLAEAHGWVARDGGGHTEAVRAGDGKARLVVDGEAVWSISLRLLSQVVEVSGDGSRGSEVLSSRRWRLV